SAHRLLRVAHEQADVGTPARLQPRRDAGGAEPTGEARAAAELAHVRGRGHPAGAEEGLGAHVMPSPSGRPNITLRFWTACEDVPFQRLSSDEKTSSLPVWESAAAKMRQKLVASTSRVPGGSCTTSTNGSAA